MEKIPLLIEKGYFLGLKLDLSQGGNVENDDVMFMEFPPEYEKMGRKPADWVVQIYWLKLKGDIFGTKIFVEFPQSAEQDSIHLPTEATFGFLAPLLLPELKDMAKVNGIRTLQPVMFVGEEKEAEAIREGNRKKWQALYEFYYGASLEELALIPPLILTASSFTSKGVF